MSISLLPKCIAHALPDITPAQLRKQGIKLLMLDFDNTIVPYTTDVPTENMKEWISVMKKSGIRLCVVSNSKKERVKVFCAAYGLDCITHAGSALQHTASPLRMRRWRVTRFLRTPWGQTARGCIPSWSAPSIITISG